MLKILSIFGTRPEAIKMAPVIHAMRQQTELFVVKVCVTAQHRGMLDSPLKLFEIEPDYDLDIMSEDQSPSRVAAAVLEKLEPVLKKEQAGWLLIQGDTTTAAAAALAGFHAGLRVAHIEAGLRTGNKWQPFPEEINRRIVSLLADLHFAPTENARQNLIDEGIESDRISVTGNPGIDALKLMLQRPVPAEVSSLLDGLPVILVTAHRRENFGPPLENICQALLEIARRYRGQIRIVYPVHRNPQVDLPVRQLLGGVEGIILLDPVDYQSLVHLAQNSFAIVTDSGGLQEEAASLGKPVLVLRNVTERPEVVNAGVGRVVGVETESIVAEISRLRDDSEAYRVMSVASEVYGDGNASERILRALLDFK
jgi:UDP-N-acetylglucosamine 2-epimerase (non-hydrolysing)